MMLLKADCPDELCTRLDITTLIKYVILIGLEGVPVVDIPVVPCHVETQGLTLIAPTVKILGTIFDGDTHVQDHVVCITLILIKLIGSGSFN